MQRSGVVLQNRAAVAGTAVFADDIGGLEHALLVQMPQFVAIRRKFRAQENKKAS